MIKKTIASIIMVLFFIPQLIYANNETWSYLDNIVDQALLLTKQEKYIEAKQILEHFSDHFVKTHPKEINITMKDLRVISISTDEAIKALTAVSSEPSDRIRKVTQLRLAIDALHTEHQPLWRSTEKAVLTSFEKMKAAALNGKIEEFKQVFTIFSQSIDTIYPSLVIDLDPDELARLDSHLRFLETYDNVNEQNKQEHLNIMENDMFHLFGKTKKDEADPSLILVMITTGSIIFASLLYVGWKKYKGEKINTFKNHG